MTETKDCYFGVGILHSRLSLSRYVNIAEQSKETYTFSGATRNVRWLKGEYAYLAPNGAASLLRRLCIKFDWLKDEDLIELRNLERYNTVILPHAIELPTQSHKILAAWISQGGYLLVSGRSGLPVELLGLSRIEWYSPNGYTAISHGEYDIIAGYRGYTMGIAQPASGSQVIGSAYEILDPQKGSASPNNRYIGPGIVKAGRVLYITPPIFETFGAMLQGHVNFEDMRGWGHRYKYLDWLGRFVKDILNEAGWQHLWRIRVKPWGEYHGVIVLRHDTDESSDTTYLDYERNNQIPATYAILNDRHRRRWLKAIATHSEAEACYHFDSSPEKNLISNLFSRKSKCLNINLPKKISRKGLWSQLRKARDKLGIPIVTAQRHNSCFFYPQILDAINYLYEQESEVLGLGTMFRFTNIMFEGEKEGEDTYVVQHPDTSVPFWFPFKLWYADTDNHYPLKGWDITHVVEPEPWLTKHLFNQEEYLEEGVYTLGFHPAHCRGKSFRDQGNWDWFKYGVELGKSHGYLFASCKEIFALINQWESLVFGISTTEGFVENRQYPYPIAVYLEHFGGKISFEEKKTSIEFVRPNMIKMVLGSGDKVHFSIG